MSCASFSISLTLPVRAIGFGRNPVFSTSAFKSLARVIKLSMFFLMSFSLASSSALVGDFAGNASELSGSWFGSVTGGGRRLGLAAEAPAARMSTSVPVPAKTVKNLRLVSEHIHLTLGPSARNGACFERASLLVRVVSLPKKRCPVSPIHWPEITISTLLDLVAIFLLRCWWIVFCTF